LDLSEGALWAGLSNRSFVPLYADLQRDVDSLRRARGVQLTHLDLLINWVENGVNPGDFISIDPTDPTKKTLRVKGAHQLGLQKFTPKVLLDSIGCCDESSDAEVTF
jgi:hypothetical protein